MRGPNHFDEAEDGIVTVFNTAQSGNPPTWETRWYPQSCLEPQTWQEAMEILDVGEVQK